jgi:hypothetical protein
MQTRWLMTASAALMGLVGLALQFAPEVVLASATSAPEGSLRAAGQVTGALYLGFAMLNWMSRGVRIGGIYARPLTMGNLVHFVAAALALLKHAASGTSPAAWWPALLYSAFAAAFGFVAFTHPRDVTGPSVGSR